MLRLVSNGLLRSLDKKDLPKSQNKTFITIKLYAIMYILSTNVSDMEMNSSLTVKNYIPCKTCHIIRVTLAYSWTKWTFGSTVCFQVLDNCGRVFQIVLVVPAKGNNHNPTLF